MRVIFNILRPFYVEKQCKYFFRVFFPEKFSTTRVKPYERTDGLVQDCSKSSALAMDLL